MDASMLSKLYSLEGPFVTIYLDTPGEWVPAAVGLGLAFLVAVIGVSALGWWVLRGDRLNRRYQDAGLHHGSGEDH